MTTTATTLKDRLPADLATARLALVSPRTEHAPAIATLANNENVHRWMARLPFPYTLDDAHHFIDTVAAGPSERCYVIVHDGSVVGVIGLTLEEGKAPELGYWLGETFWGKGFATEAAEAVVGAARAAGATAIRSRALKDNAGSRNVLRKAGFVETHEALDCVGNCAGKLAIYLERDLSR